ncbi:MAG: DUF5659 domain-containing protein [Candidatus Nealsonbacteria bacterium]|nr:DUF5659 domain-containing protein [Candidatus Nealsonbacteria bacterium]
MIMKKLKDNQPTKDQGIPFIDDKFFITTDLGIAAALLTANFELLTLDKSEIRKVKFVFNRENGIVKVADDFWSNRLEQKVRSFWDNIGALKNRLYSNE